MPKPKPPKDPVDRFRTALDRGGVAGLETAIRRVGKQAESSLKPVEKLADAMASPKLRRAAGEALAVADATRKVAAQTRERLSLESRRASVMSGAYSRELRAQQLIGRERERVESLERRAQFDQRYGRLGGAAYYASAVTRSGAFRTGMAVATGLGGAAGASALKGFQGTVEWNRLQLEVSMVSREMAGALRPAIEITTRALQSFRKFLESFTPQQQNLLAIGALSFGGLAAAGLARAGLGGIMGVGGAVLGGAAAGGGAGGAAAAGAAGGLAARAGGAARFGSFAFQGFEAFRGGEDIMTDSSPLRGFGRQLARMPEKIAGIDFVARNLGFESGGTGGQIFDSIFGSNDRPAASGAANPERRKVTIADAGFEDPGTARNRLTTALALTDANADGRDATGKIYDFLVETFGRSRPSPPPALR